MFDNETWSFSQISLSISPIAAIDLAAIAHKSEALLCMCTILTWQC